VTQSVVMPTGRRAPEGDPRAIWLRSRAWNECVEGSWTAEVIGTLGGRFAPMPIEQAFEVSVKRCVLEDALSVEILDGRARLASHWQAVGARDCVREDVAGG
jgi:hypothetical protein